MPLARGWHPIGAMTRIPTRKAALARSDIDRERLANKLCERWLFARSIVHLYELVVSRLAGTVGERSLAHEAERLAGFGQRKRLHAELLEALLSQLGRPPRERETPPDVNLAAGQAEALLELSRAAEAQPRHLIEALLAAEHLDHLGWELLVELAVRADLEEDWLRSLRAASREGAEHLHVLRGRVEQLAASELLRPPPAFF